jgi:pantothenate kinase type III
VTALALDLGNTRLKAARVRASGGVEPVGCPGEWTGVIEPGSDLHGAALESVKGKERCLLAASRREALPELRAALEAIGLTGEAAGLDFPIPMPTVYQDPSQLGVDRWLGALAGWRRAGGSCVVLGAGTALTLDVVSRDGEHLGGLIAPGFGLSLHALHEAARLPLVTAAAIGRTTGDCIRGGLAFVLGGGVVAATRSMLGLAGAGARLLLTGGDAAVVSGLFGARAPDLELELVEHLVLEGLAYAGGVWR